MKKAFYINQKVMVVCDDEELGNHMPYGEVKRRANKYCPHQQYLVELQEHCGDLIGMRRWYSGDELFGLKEKDKEPKSLSVMQMESDKRVVVQVSVCEH